MGEIFSRERALKPLLFTGERMTSDIGGQIEYEHVHRYLFARHLSDGRDILDVASGEGYGSALLAQRANRVVGIEIASEAVRHAAATYTRSNLCFVSGDARALPIQNASFDMVVSFETIEHIFEQEAFISEVQRVLRPGGVVIISSPDRDVYSPSNAPVNPFHLKELTGNEFVGLMQDRFRYCQLYMQRPLTGCAIMADPRSDSLSGCVTFERRGETHLESSSGLSRAIYLIMVASDEPLWSGFDSLYIDNSDVDYGRRMAVDAELARQELSRQTEKTEQVKAEFDRKSEELMKIQEERLQLRNELSKVSKELALLRSNAASLPRSDLSARSVAIATADR